MVCVGRWVAWAIEGAIDAGGYGEGTEGWLREAEPVRAGILDAELLRDNEGGTDVFWATETEAVDNRPEVNWPAEPRSDLVFKLWGRDNDNILHSYGDDVENAGDSDWYWEENVIFS